MSPAFTRRVNHRENCLHQAVSHDSKRRQRKRANERFGAGGPVALQHDERRNHRDDPANNGHRQCRAKRRRAARPGDGFSFQWGVRHVLSSHVQTCSHWSRRVTEIFNRRVAETAVTLIEPMNSSPEPFSYDSIAAEYATKVDSAPYNAFYERPAMLNTLPDVEGQRILDAGCGSGWYTERLLERGAIVEAFDASTAMAEYARNRLGSRPNAIKEKARVTVASLGDQLPYSNHSFAGVISPLVLHYLADWRPALRELSRILEPGGWLLLSTHHPSADAAHFETKDYFRTEHVRDNWWVGEVQFYRRSLTEIFSSLLDSGFKIDKVHEPMPTEQFRLADPESYAKLMYQPAFLIILATTSRVAPGAENA